MGFQQFGVVVRWALVVRLAASKVRSRFQCKTPERLERRSLPKYVLYASNLRNSFFLPQKLYLSNQFERERTSTKYCFPNEGRRHELTAGGTIRYKIIINHHTSPLLQHCYELWLSHGIKPPFKTCEVLTVLEKFAEPPHQGRGDVAAEALWRPMCRTRALWEVGCGLLGLCLLSYLCSTFQAFAMMLPVTVIAKVSIHHLVPLESNSSGFRAFNRKKLGGFHHYNMGSEISAEPFKWPSCIGTYDTFLILRGKAQISTSFRDQVNQHAGICANPPATDSMGYQILPCNCCTEKHFQGDFCEAWLFFSGPGSWEKRWWTCLILEVVGVCRHYQGSLLIYVFMGFEIRWIPGFLVWFLCRQICGISSITGFARPS